MATGQVLFQRFFYTKSFVKHSMEVRGSAWVSSPRKSVGGEGWVCRPAGLPTGASLPSCQSEPHSRGWEAPGPDPRWPLPPGAPALCSLSPLSVGGHRHGDKHLCVAMLTFQHVSMACVHLASKIEEAPRRIRDVMNVFHRLRQLREKK